MAVLGYFIERGDFDSERLGLVGVSWGGHFSTRVAARNDPRIDGVVALCGAAHELFSQPVDAYEAALQSPERMTIINLARHMQVEATAEAIQAALSRFSLLDAGIVGAGKTITTPLLIVNSTTDPLAPLGDLMMVHEAAANSDIWLLGTSPHCAVNYWPVTIPQIAGWLVDRMNLQPGN
jgi:esterase FrsA